MANYDFKIFETKAAAAQEWLAKEYRGLRTGRASPAILDSIMVSAYGSMMPLKQVASVGVEDARTLRVQPFDAALLKDIERAIAGADLGVGTTTPSARIDSNGIIRSSSGGFQFPDGTNQTTAASSGIVGAGEEREGYGDNLCTAYWGSASCVGNLINCANSIKRKTSQIYVSYVGIDGNTRYRWQHYYLCIA